MMTFLKNKDLLVFLVASVAISSACKRRRNNGDLDSSKQTQGPDSSLVTCDQLIADFKVETKTALALQEPQRTARSCNKINEFSVIPGVIQRDALTKSEISDLQKFEKSVEEAYRLAVSNGTIKEGYKWLTNSWQGLNEMCESVVGTSVGATTGYKCIDKQTGMISSLQEMCLKKRFCMPPSLV
jgi:hypothetical protein